MYDTQPQSIISVCLFGSRHNFVGIKDGPPEERVMEPRNKRSRTTREANRTAILVAIGNGNKTVFLIQDATNLSGTTVKKRLYEMAEQGIVTRTMISRKRVEWGLA